MIPLPADPARWPPEAQEELRYRAGCYLNDHNHPPYTVTDIAKADRAAEPIVRRWWERSQTDVIP